MLYLQDGQNLFDPHTAFGGQDWRADVTADDLIRRGVIDPLILVGIYNAGVRRISEYTPTKDPRRRKGGKGDRYAKMMAQELKPFIDREYRTRRSAAFSGVGGSSLGALVSLETGLLYPRIFGRLAILSPSVWWDNRSILEMVRAYKSDCASAHLAGFGNQRRGCASAGDRRSEIVMRCPGGKGLARGYRPVLHRGGGRGTP